MKIQSLLPVLYLLTIPVQLLGQSPYNSPNHNRALLRNVPSQNIAYLKASESGHLEQLLYYFSRSFEVSQTGCDSCPVDAFQFFNIDLFDITQHEHLRTENERISFVFKKKYLVELHSVSELPDAFPVNEADYQEFIQHVPDSGLPKWNMEWDSDYQFIRYRENVDFYIQHFPHAYGSTSASPGFISIAYSDFKHLSTEEKQNILDNENNYELIR